MTPTNAPRSDAATPPPVRSLFEALRDVADESGLFGPVEVEASMLVCAAKESAEPASYRVEFEDGALYVSLVTDNRWLSESIESDLLNTGDKIEDLIDEELVEQGFDDGPLPIKHYRSDDMLFTFRSPLPIDPAAAGEAEAVETARQCLFAYEAAFRELGDMQESEED